VSDDDDLFLRHEREPETGYVLESRCQLSEGSRAAAVSARDLSFSAGMLAFEDVPVITSIPLTTVAQIVAGEPFAAPVRQVANLVGRGSL
jgi:hypothetical protein